MLELRHQAAATTFKTPTINSQPNFNISGTDSAAGILSASTVSAANQFNIGALRPPSARLKTYPQITPITQIVS